MQKASASSSSSSSIHLPSAASASDARHRHSQTSNPESSKKRGPIIRNLGRQILCKKSISSCHFRRISGRCPKKKPSTAKSGPESRSTRPMPRAFSVFQRMRTAHAHYVTGGLGANNARKNRGKCGKLTDPSRISRLVDTARNFFLSFSSENRDWQGRS